MQREIPRVRWGDFLPRLKWRQGEHVALIGPTGTGKTTLALELLERRDYVSIIATKPKDKTLRGLKREGFVTIPRWPPPHADVRRVVLWPKWETEADDARQAGAIREAMQSILKAGSWCVFTDDVQHLTEHLKLRRTLVTYWLQARSLGISVLAATQRPRVAPLEMFNQSTHLFLWNTPDADDLRRVGGFGGFSGREIRELVGRLPKHQCLYVNTRDGALAITRAERTRPT